MSDQDLPVTVYTQESYVRHPLKLFRAVWRDLVAGRELAFQLAVRDLKAQYRQAALGLLWAFIIPLSNTAVWLFIQSSGVVRIQDTGLPYPVFVLSGTIIWSIFMDAINAPLKQTTAAKGTLAKLNFPRESLIVSGVYQTVFNAAIKTVILVAALLLLGVRPDFQLLLFPFAVLALILTGTALGLLLTPLGTLYTDIGRGLPLLLQFLMFLSPVVYPIPKSGWAETLFNINPLTPLIVTARDFLTGQPAELLVASASITALMLVVLVVGLAIYRISMPILVERMSA